MTSQPRPTNVHLDDAREAVQRSDNLSPTSQEAVFEEEIRPLRDALRALIQHAEELEREVRRLGRAY